MANHPLVRMNGIQSSQIGEMRFVIRSRRDSQGRTETELNRFATTGIGFKIAMRCESAETVKEVVRHGAGVGILYRDVIKRKIDRGEFKVLKLVGFDVVGQRYIVYSKEKPLSAFAREFLSLLRAAVANDGLIKPLARQTSDGRQNGHTRDYTLRSKLLA
jgi:DNA-binding transcriptional LysR family regulator